MKVKILIATIILFTAAACTKNQYTTAPQLTFLSVTSDVVPINASVIFNLEFTDKEGDIQDSIYVQKRALNCPQDTFGRPYYLMPDVPTKRNSKGEIQVRYSHGINLEFPDIGDPQCVGNDTCIFQFVLKDKANNRSDTAFSTPVVIIKR